LAGFPLLVFASQVVWVTYSPVTTSVSRDLGVSKDAVGLLVMLFPILYILMAYPAGRLLDTRFRESLIAASILFILTGLGRLVSPENYTAIFIGQVLAGIAQPFAVNGITPYASVYFQEDRKPLAVSAGSAAMFAGMIVAMAVGGLIYSNWGVTGLSYYSAVLVVLGGLWTIAMAVKVNPLGEPALEHLPAFESIKKIAGKRMVWLFAGIIGMGLAILDILMTWIEPVLRPIGLASIAGTATALMLTSGVIGSAVIPPVAAKRNSRKTFIILAGLAGMLSYVILSAWTNSLLLYVLLAITGFMLMAGLPVIFEWVEKTTPVDRQGETIGVIMITGHIIAVAALAVSTPLTSSARLFFILLAALSGTAFLLSSILPSDKTIVGMKEE
jgi:predicted MFS family arabinose efflux permease